MEEENKKEGKDREYEAKKEEMRRKDEEKTKKNQRRREKLKTRKGKGKGGKGDVEMGEHDEKAVNGGEGGGIGKKMLGPAKVPIRGVGDSEEDVGDDTLAKSVEGVGVVIHDDD